MNQVIVNAINTRRRMSFTYNGKPRIVEPQCYGIGSRGTELLRAHQIQGGAQREPLFDVSRMIDLAVLNDHFAQPGPNYKKNDSAMKIIFAQL
jgi:predicted DNA-binding transcriptional regulator YafY